MTFKCPKCGQAYLLDPEQDTKMFRCCFVGQDGKQCDTYFTVSAGPGGGHAHATVFIEVFDTVPSYTPIKPVKDCPELFAGPKGW